MEREYLIECTISGVGESFKGTLAQAIEKAREYRRHPTWDVAVWFEGKKVAQTLGDSLWVKEEYRREL